MHRVLLGFSPQRDQSFSSFPKFLAPFLIPFMSSFNLGINHGINIVIRSFTLDE